MKVICKKTTSHDFDLTEVTTVFSNGFDYSYGGYGIEIDKEYIVMGLIVYQDTNCLYYLIDAKNGQPDLFPYLLFDVSDNSLPKDWFIKVRGKKDYNGIYMISGFDELCNDLNFYRKLLERDEEALLVYFQRKIDIEKSFI